MVWERIFEDLYDQITSGRITGRLPSTTQMMADYEAGFATVRRAVKELETRGLVLVQGRGLPTLVITPQGFDLARVAHELSTVIRAASDLHGYVMAELDRITRENAERESAERENAGRDPQGRTPAPQGITATGWPRR